MSEAISSFEIFLYLLSALITVTTSIVIRDVRKENLKEEIHTTTEANLESSRPIFELKFDHRKGEHPFFKKKGDTHVRQLRGRLYNNGGTVNKINFYFNCQEERPSNLQEILNKKSFFRKKSFGEDFGSMAGNSSKLLISPKFDWPGEKKLWFVLWIDYEYLNRIQEQFIIDLNINGESVSEETIRYHTHPAITDAEKNLIKN